MAGNSKTPKSVAIKSAQNKATGRNGGGNAKVSAQTTPGSKGVMVGKNAGKGVVQSSAPKSAMTKMNMGGSIKGKKC
jgi:hypothetical protein